MILEYLKICMEVHRERSMDIFNVYDLEKIKVHIYNSRFPLNFEGLCNIAIQPLYFTPRETILKMSSHVVVR